MKTKKSPSAIHRRRMNISNIKMSKEYDTDEKEQEKPLFLIMQKVWFDQIEKGKKIEEYREGTDFYKSRLCNIDKKTSEITSIKNYKSVILQVGYNTGARRMIVEVNKIDLKRDFTIHLGNILERQNF